MTTTLSIISGFFGIAVVLAKIVMDYSTLKKQVDSMEKRNTEDRVVNTKKFDEICSEQNQMSSVLKEVSTILRQFEKSIDTRLSSLEHKIDSITTLKVGK